MQEKVAVYYKKENKKEISNNGSIQNQKNEIASYAQANGETVSIVCDTCAGFEAFAALLINAGAGEFDTVLYTSH